MSHGHVQNGDTTSVLWLQGIDKDVQLGRRWGWSREESEPANKTRIWASMSICWAGLCHPNIHLFFLSQGEYCYNIDISNDDDGNDVSDNYDGGDDNYADVQSGDDRDNDDAKNHREGYD